MLWSRYCFLSFVSSVLRYSVIATPRNCQTQVINFSFLSVFKQGRRRQFSIGGKGLKTRAGGVSLGVWGPSPSENLESRGSEMVFSTFS